LRSQCTQSREAIRRGELAIFEQATGGMIAVRFEGITSFVVGSSRSHPYPLVFDRFSVHAEQDAMTTSRGEIARVGREPLAHGRIP
jgi:hypothetical protein